MKREYYVTPKPSPIMKFFWTAAGADHYILERATYSDQIKYMCLGGIVVATGVMAAIAGGYAFYTIFEPRGSAIESQFHLGVALASMLFGCVWGLMIFNIDRFIVTSTGKGDGTEAITWEEFKGAIPRIVMGAIIALTISKPVEIRMFKTEIDVELHKEQMVKQQEYLSKIDSIYSDRIKAEKNKIEKWEDEIKQKDQVYLDLETQWIKEGQDGGFKEKANNIRRSVDRADAERKMTLEKNTPLIKESYSNLKKFEQQKQKDIENGTVVAEGLDGLLERIKLAHHIAGFWISLFITLLFMTIELTPIFFKLMLVKTPYDYMEENIKELMKAEEGIYIQYNYYKDKQGLERDLVTHMKVEKMIHEKVALLEKQKELTKYAVDRYGEKIKRQIDENPNAFIKDEPIEPTPSDN